jgi:hypothetical protein
MTVVAYWAILKNFSVNSSSLKRLFNNGDSIMILKFLIKLFTFKLERYSEFNSDAPIELLSS